MKSIYNLLKKKFPVRAEMLLGEVSKVDVLLKKTEEYQSLKLHLKKIDYCKKRMQDTKENIDTVQRK